MKPDKKTWTAHLRARSHPSASAKSSGRYMVAICSSDQITRKENRVLVTISAFSRQPKVSGDNRITKTLHKSASKFCADIL